MVKREPKAANRTADDPNRLIREEAGRYLTADARFTAETQVSGTWYLTDAGQLDELGMPRVTGPFRTLAQVHEAIAAARSMPAVASLLRARLRNRGAARRN